MTDVCKSCGRTKKIQSRGMCTTCYRHQLFIENPEYAARSKARDRESKRDRRMADDAWREAERARDRARRPAKIASRTGQCTLCGTPGIVAKGLCPRCYMRTYAQERRALDPARAKTESARATERARRNYDAIREAKARPCADCGQPFPLCVMDFDHVRGTKLFSLSSAGQRALATVLAEIAKCDVVCANCHRIRTCLRRTDRGRCHASHTAA